jgi:N-acetylglucosamine-6-phosphate deacetylase
MKILAKKLYTNRQIFENQLIEVAENKIVSVSNFENAPVDHTFENLSAGFIETHINGGEEYYFTQHPNETTIDDIYQASFKLGTAYVLPCLITSSLENILQGIESTKNYIKKNPQSGVLGMHLEGPFLNIKKRGAHLAKYVRMPTDVELSEIVKYGKDVIKIMTIAPENFTASQIEMLVESGIKVSAGHSNATYQEAQNAFSQRVHLVTHLYNAMSAFGHREPGLVGATFDNDTVYAPIILDGIHCDFAAARIAYHQKKDKLFLISDALFLGHKVTQFQWQEFDAYLLDGQYKNSEGNLAGAAVSLDDCVRNAVKFVGIPLEEAIEMATERPAKVLGLASKIGSVAVGQRATFTVFDDNLTKFESYKF